MTMDLTSIYAQIDQIKKTASAQKDRLPPRTHKSKALVLPESYGLAGKIAQPRQTVSKIKNKLKSLPVIGGMFRWFLAITRIHVRLEQLQRSVADIRLFRLSSQLINVQARVQTNERQVFEHQNQLRSLIDETQRLHSDLSQFSKLLTRKIATEITTSSSALAIAANAEDSKFITDMYFAFEKRFRADSEVLRQSFVPYIEIITGLSTELKAAPILDLGCGRGEWLEVLRSNGLKNLHGVDSNEQMVNDVIARGFQGAHNDVLSYLRCQTTESHAVISAFHLVEHLPLEVLVLMMKEIYRVLKKGGIAILETPNPENLMVGACNFYTDPTHRNPIPPHTLDFFATYSGFPRTTVLRKSMPQIQVTSGDPAVSYILDWFKKGQDYAIIAYKE